VVHLVHLPVSFTHLCGCCTGVGDSIVEFSKAKDVDMVVIGSRGLGSIQRWVHDPPVGQAAATSGSRATAGGPLIAALCQAQHQRSGPLCWAAVLRTFALIRATYV
jgi:hypothetical protein